jgi:Tfp pilus assembly pilus retraction ATPase PilT
MFTLERALANLVKEGAISQVEALFKTTRPEEVERLLNQA